MKKKKIYRVSWLKLSKQSLTVVILPFSHPVYLSNLILKTSKGLHHHWWRQSSMGTPQWWPPPLPISYVYFFSNFFFCSLTLGWIFLLVWLFVGLVLKVEFLFFYFFWVWGLDIAVRVYLSEYVFMWVLSFTMITWVLYVCCGLAMGLGFQKWDFWVRCGNCDLYMFVIDWLWVCVCESMWLWIKAL